MSDIIRLNLFQSGKKPVIEPNENKKNKRRSNPIFISILFACLVMALGLVGYIFLTMTDTPITGFFKKEVTEPISDTTSKPIEPKPKVLTTDESIIQIKQANEGLVKLLYVIENLNFPSQTVLKTSDLKLLIEGYVANDSAINELNQSLSLSGGVESIKILFTEQLGDQISFCTESRIPKVPIENFQIDINALSIPPFKRAKVMRSIDSLAVISKLSNRSIEPLKEEDSKLGRMYEVTFIANGSFINLKNFISGLNNMDKLIDIRSMGLQIEQGNNIETKSVEATLVLGMHFIQSQNSKPAAAASEAEPPGTENSETPSKQNADRGGRLK
ncbi:hypothetical protein JXI42_08025 [bacterium]|nr:hypothetical protein [bacterium]